VARAHQHCLDTLLFQTAAAALQALALDPRSLGGQLGMVGVLHTWPRDLASHPHVHSLVPSGALAPEGLHGLSPRSAAWLVPVRALSTLFRGTCKAALTPAGLCDLVSPQVWHKDWVTHCQPAGTGTAVLPSFAPYLSRLALTTNRLEMLEDGPVTFRVKKHAGAGWKRLTRPAEACIHRFLQPVLPRGCITVRYSGVLSPSRRQVLPQISTLLAACLSNAPAPERIPLRNRQQTRPAPAQERCCRTCGGPLVFFVRLAPHPKAPPECQRRAPPPGLASRRPWRSPRRARPCWHRLRGPLWPAPEKSVEACHHPRPPRANALLQDGNEAVMRPVASPCALRLRLFSAPQPPLRPIENPKSLTPPHRLVHPRIVWRRGATRLQSARESLPPSLLQNRACQFSGTRLLSDTPPVMGTLAGL